MPIWAMPSSMVDGLDVEILVPAQRRAVEVEDGSHHRRRETGETVLILDRIGGKPVTPVTDGDERGARRRARHSPEKPPKRGIGIIELEAGTEAQRTETVTLAITRIEEWQTIHARRERHDPVRRRGRGSAQGGRGQPAKPASRMPRRRAPRRLNLTGLPRPPCGAAPGPGLRPRTIRRVSPSSHRRAPRHRRW